jgi:hypothetical protein
MVQSIAGGSGQYLQRGHVAGSLCSGPRRITPPAGANRTGGVLSEALTLIALPDVTWAGVTHGRIRGQVGQQGVGVR